MIKDSAKACVLAAVIPLKAGLLCASMLEALPSHHIVSTGVHLPLISLQFVQLHASLVISSCNRCHCRCRNVVHHSLV